MHAEPQSEPVSPAPAATPYRVLWYRFLGLLLLGAFAVVQYSWWRDDRLYRHMPQWEPHPVLGPLYFLCNTPTHDDWLGWVLLAGLVPCLVAFPVRPTRWTALLCVAALAAWVVPGAYLSLTFRP